MNKSGTLITSALLTLGLAAAAMAADLPKSAAPMAADTPAAPAAAPAADASKKPTTAAKKKRQESQENHHSRSVDSEVRLLVQRPRPRHGGRGVSFWRVQYPARYAMPC